MIFTVSSKALMGKQDSYPPPLPTPTPWGVSHVENPDRQPWVDMIATLVNELVIPMRNIVVFESGGTVCAALPGMKRRIPRNE
ncbi:hypothetical protein GB937_008874 [Aspergillus fischeri]|nr:hypothetical protein GB937_008874 [Aspergillus fischeri]